MRPRAGFILLALFMFTPPSVFSQEGFNYVSLTLTIYGDGAVHVAETLTVESSQPSIEVTVVGRSLENLLVIDENGSFLPSQVNDTLITVETLGASLAEVEYDCLDLTSKQGVLWTMKVESPLNFTLIFPVNSTVVDVSQIPLEIKSLGDRPVMVLGPGSHEFSYVIGLFGIEAEAANIINEAQRTIDAFTSQGLNLSRPTTRLNEARSAYLAHDYRSAKYAAEQALALAYTTRELAQNATEAVLKAEAAVRVARGQGRTEGLADAESLLTSAKVSYQAGEYAKAMTIAEEAERTAESARAPFPSSEVITVGMALTAATLVSLFYVVRRRAPKEESFNPERLFKEKPWLNPDQRRVIGFLAVRKGSAFEAEIREAVNQPKSTVWRIIRKLEDEGILSVEQLRGQNYVTLRPYKGKRNVEGGKMAKEKQEC